MLLLDTKKTTFHVRIKVFGIGGGGSNVVDTMIRAKLDRIFFSAVNTDLQFLMESQAESKIQIGEKVTQGLGAGANPNIGRQAAEESIDKIHEALEDADIVVLTAGMGGGTGTGAAPVIAEAARQQGKMVIAFVTSPFEFEGAQRSRNASSGLDELKEHVHTLIHIPNNKLYDVITEDTSLVDSFKEVDNLLMEAVRSLTRLILEPGLINLDFADVRSVMGIGGNSLITFGSGQGVHRANKAVEAAMSNILLDIKSLRGAKGLLVNVVGGSDMTLHEVTRCIRKLQTSVHEEANIIFGANIDPNIQDNISVTIIATGIEDESDSFQRFGHYRPLQAIDPTPKNEPVRRIPTSPISNNRTEENIHFEPYQLSANEDELDIPTYIRKNRRHFGSNTDS